MEMFGPGYDKRKCGKELLQKLLGVEIDKI